MNNFSPNIQVAKDYSQPEVRRQQDEDKRLRLQVFFTLFIFERKGKGQAASAAVGI